MRWAALGRAPVRHHARITIVPAIRSTHTSVQWHDAPPHTCQGTITRAFTILCITPRRETELRGIRRRVNTFDIRSNHERSRATRHSGPQALGNTTSAHAYSPLYAPAAADATLSESSIRICAEARRRRQGSAAVATHCGPSRRHRCGLRPSPWPWRPRARRACRRSRLRSRSRRGLRGPRRAGPPRPPRDPPHARSRRRPHRRGP